jgi:hypothetical protein
MISLNSFYAEGLRMARCASDCLAILNSFGDMHSPYHLHRRTASAYRFSGGGMSTNWLYLLLVWLVDIEGGNRGFRNFEHLIRSLAGDTVCHPQTAKPR